MHFDNMFVRNPVLIISHTTKSIVTLVELFFWFSKIAFVMLKSICCASFDDLKDVPPSLCVTSESVLDC